jgi:hypothetical protein
MSISNDQELVKAVAQASSLLQEIHDYCGRALREDSKVNFPRGLIGTAASYRGRCPGYLTADHISSCAYGFMYLDVLWWLLSRTDIVSVGKEMAIKSALVTLGTILEASLRIPGLPLSNVLSTKAPCGVRVRLEEVTKHGWISQEQCTALKELWKHRNYVHIKLLPSNELDLYKVEHVNSSLAALLVLMSKLKTWHTEQQHRKEAPVVAGGS